MPLSRSEVQQQVAVTDRRWYRRALHAARYRYTLAPRRGLRTKAHVMATAVSSAARGWRILFFPESPSPKTMLSKLCLYAAHRVVTSPDEFHDAAIKWWDDTYAANTTLPATFVAKAGVLNLACEDISKSRVDQVFADIFGYGLTVDPTRYVGPYVEKSEANASHDGRILDRPLMTPRPGRVYQRLVDNTVPGG